MSVCDLADLKLGSISDNLFFTFSNPFIDLFALFLATASGPWNLLIASPTTAPSFAALVIALPNLPLSIALL